MIEHLEEKVLIQQAELDRNREERSEMVHLRERLGLL